MTDVAEREREELYAESARRHRERIREANRVSWQDFYLRLAVSLRASAEEYDRKAETLREREGG